MTLFHKRLLLPSLALILILAGPVAALDTSAPKGTTQKVKTDTLGKTIQYVNTQGHILRSVRQDLFGPELGRKTVTDYQYDGKGQLLSATVANQLMTRKETYTKKGQIEKAEQDDLFGLEWGRHRVFDDYQYKKGRLIRNRETSKLHTAIHHYNEQGRIIKSELDRKTGLGAKRKTVITMTYDKKSGKPTSQTETNKYGVIKTTVFDKELLLPAKQQTNYNFGLGAKQKTTIQYTRDKKTGLPLQSVETNAYGVTRKKFDTLENGTHGIVVSSESETNFGVEAKRKTKTVVQSSKQYGLVQATKDVNQYETVWTLYDTYNEGLFGIVEKIETKRNFGLGMNRHSITIVKASTETGLYTNTKEYMSPNDERGKKKTPEKPDKRKKK